MKKLALLLTLFLSLVLLLAPGCGKDPIDPQTPPKVLTWSITPLYDTVKEGSKVQIKIVTNADSISADFPEAKTLYSPINRTVESQPITQTTIYHMAFYINGKVVDIANPTYFVRKIILPPPPTVTVSANPYTVIRGKTTIVSWNVAGEVDSIKSNLPDVSTKGLSTTFGSITMTPQSSMLITVTAYGKGGSTSDTATITVIDPPPPTPEELLCNFGPWKMVYLEFQDIITLSWKPAEIWSCRKDDSYHFYLNHRAVNDVGAILCSSDDQTIEGPWSLNGSVLNVGYNLNIITLNKDSLVWIYNTGSNVRETFIHSAKK